MSEMQELEAAWTLAPGPLDSEATARALLQAVGDVVAVRPARYDLDRRGRWKAYRGANLLVDMITQRTQLVTIEEEESVANGGVLVVVATGKQGRPPQAVARWRHRWPPSSEEIGQWTQAVQDAFNSLKLESFVLRAGDRNYLVADGADRSQWQEFWD